MDFHNIQTAYLCLGSNLGNKKINLEKATELIGKSCGSLITGSSIFMSRSWGYESENDYYNKCLKIETDLSPEDLLDQVLKIEQVMGRERISIEYADRIIDIDILFYGEAIIDSASLVIPHPRIPERMFVLKPMMELDPELKHPSLQKTIQVLFENCSDNSDLMRM